MHIFLRHISFLLFQIHFVIPKATCTSPKNRLSVAHDCEPVDRKSQCEAVYEGDLNTAGLFFLSVLKLSEEKGYSSNMNQWNYRTLSINNKGLFPTWLHFNELHFESSALKASKYAQYPNQIPLCISPIHSDGRVLVINRHSYWKDGWQTSVFK